MQFWVSEIQVVKFSEKSEFYELLLFECNLKTLQDFIEKHTIN